MPSLRELAQKGDEEARAALTLRAPKGKTADDVLALAPDDDTLEKALNAFDQGLEEPEMEDDPDAAKGELEDEAIALVVAETGFDDAKAAGLVDKILNIFGM